MLPSDSTHQRRARARPLSFASSKYDRPEADDRLKPSLADRNVGSLLGNMSSATSFGVISVVVMIILVGAVLISIDNEGKKIVTKYTHNKASSRTRRIQQEARDAALEKPDDGTDGESGGLKTRPVQSTANRRISKQDADAVDPEVARKRQEYAEKIREKWQARLKEMREKAEANAKQQNKGDEAGNPPPAETEATVPGHPAASDGGGGGGVQGGQPAAQGQPEQGQPEQGQPEQGQPEQGQPEQGQPAQGQPAQGQPAQGQPAQGQPTQGQPEQGQPEQGQPTQGQPEQGQPEPAAVAPDGIPAQQQQQAPATGDGVPPSEAQTQQALHPDPEQEDIEAKVLRLQQELAKLQSQQKQ